MNDIPIVTDPRKIPPTSKMYQIGRRRDSESEIMMQANALLSEPGVDREGAVIRRDSTGAYYLHFNVKETAHA